ncbi:YebC/PmpR family DNA-binding transcriptional regulator [Candidatus Jorgensenbacteria bacterium]|nr:YebC/PmpR family DNA-binding transcriptional regulator [Candidatus Jorgensenbacteria bacterium]
MAGHSHWKQIKTHKGVADQKRGIAFSKLLNAVAIAAKSEPNPDFNPRLRTTINKAHTAGVPNENIERAIKRASSQNDNLEEIMVEAYGPGGTAIIIEAITDSRNRTIQELKALLKELGAKWAEQGSVRWAFEFQSQTNGWLAKFSQQISPEDMTKLKSLIQTIENHGDVQSVYANAI